MQQNPVFNCLDKVMFWEDLQESQYEPFGDFFETILGSTDDRRRKWEQRHGKVLIDTTTNDYLGLLRLPAAIDAKTAQVKDEVQVSSVLFQDRLEGVKNQLKTIMGAEYVLMVKSGSEANMVVTEGLCLKTVPIYFDKHSHMSTRCGFDMGRGRNFRDRHLRNEIEQALNLLEQQDAPAEQVVEQLRIPLEKARSAVQYFSFNHNDAAHLEQRIRRHGPGVVYTEGLFSVHGDLLNRQVARVAKKYGCHLVIDESHSLLGTATEAMTINAELDAGADLLTASLSKAGGAHAGVVAIQPGFFEKRYAHLAQQAGKPLDENARHKARTLLIDHFKRSVFVVFSNATSDIEEAGLMARIDFLMQQPERRKLLHDRTAYIRAKLKAAGISMTSESAMMFFQVGSEPDAVRFRDFLQDHHGLLGSLYIPPATPINAAGVRCLVNYDVCASIELTERFVDGIIDAHRRFKLVDVPSSAVSCYESLALTGQDQDQQVSEQA